MHTRLHTRCKWAHMRFIATKCTLARLRLVCARVCTDLYIKFFVIPLLSYELNYLNYLMNLSFKFHNNPSFRYGDISKTILLKIINFQCILHISTLLLLQSLQRWIITEWLWNFLKTRYQNGPTSGIIWHMSHLID